MDARAKTIPSDDFQKSASDFRSPVTVPADETEIQPTGEPRFLQIVAKTDRPTPSRTKHKLTRVTFTVSRLMEFCSKKELVNQTGHSVWEWPLVLLKELFDNALDACEEAEVA